SPCTLAGSYATVAPAALVASIVRSHGTNLNSGGGPAPCSFGRITGWRAGRSSQPKLECQPQPPSQPQPFQSPWYQWSGLPSLQSRLWSGGSPEALSQFLPSNQLSPSNHQPPWPLNQPLPSNQLFPSNQPWP